MDVFPFKFDPFQIQKHNMTINVIRSLLAFTAGHFVIYIKFDDEFGDDDDAVNGHGPMDSRK